MFEKLETERMDNRMTILIPPQKELRYKILIHRCKINVTRCYHEYNNQTNEKTIRFGKQSK